MDTSILKEKEKKVFFSHFKEIETYACNNKIEHALSLNSLLNNDYPA